jgi:glycosyltransferase involved in cell wall biosynthesis
MPTIGLAVPCYKGHITLLKRLFDSIEKQLRKPDMVVVSCSSSSDEDIPYKSSDYSFPFKIYTHRERRNAAQNRNFAADNLDTDIVSFMDADDIMHPQRVQVVEKAFKKNIVMLVHNFVYGDKDEFKFYHHILFNIGTLVITSIGWSVTHLDSNNKYGIANGHITVLKSIMKNIRYRETSDYTGREDSVFTSDIVKAYPLNVAHSPLELSKYIQSHTGGYSA